MQWLQDSYQSNVHNLNSVRCEASRHFKNKKRKYLKAKTNELETNSKIKNTRVASILRSVTSIGLIQ